MPSCYHLSLCVSINSSEPYRQLPNFKMFSVKRVLSGREYSCINVAHLFFVEGKYCVEHYECKYEAGIVHDLQELTRMQGKTHLCTVPAPLMYRISQSARMPCLPVNLCAPGGQKSPGHIPPENSGVNSI